MSSKVEVGGNGIGFFGLLGIVFITLKLTGVIAWSWWWVLAPFWVPLSITLITIAIIVISAIAFKGARK